MNTQKDLQQPETLPAYTLSPSESSIQICGTVTQFAQKLPISFLISLATPRYYKRRDYSAIRHYKNGKN
jgi:hypothetical protein